MFVGLASAIGIGLPRLFASWIATRTNQSNSMSARSCEALAVGNLSRRSFGVGRMLARIF